MIFGALCSTVIMQNVLPLEQTTGITVSFGTKECFFEGQGRKSDPNEQFEVLLAPFSPFSNWGLTNLSALLLSVIVLMGLLMTIYSGRARSAYDFIMLSLSRLVQAIVRENLYMAVQRFFTIILFLFLLVLIANMIGMIPYGFTITGSFMVTFFLALSHFAAINHIAFYKHAWTFFEMLLPAGAPLAIAPLLILIEVVSYLARVFSLSIRLFANMMSGHALLKILISFCLGLLVSASSAALLALLPWVLVFLISFLELLIAFLQAYVFATLSTLYVNDVLNLH
jgi:ATP synthase subunit 6